MFKLDDLKGVTLAMLIKYLQDMGPPINRKKDIDSIRQLIISLKNNTIDNLKTQFLANNNNVTLEKFIWLMRQCIHHSSESKHQFYYELVRLFEEIDIDSNQSIDWNEFLEFLSCNGWAQTDDHKDDEQGSMQKKIIQPIFKQATKFRKNPLMNIVQMQRNNLLLLHQSRSHHIKFITNEGDTSNFSIGAIQNSKVLSIDYSQPERLFGIMLISKKILFIEEGEIQKNYGSISSKGNQNLIQYLPYHKLWLLQTIDHQFTIFTSPKIVAALTLTMGGSSKIRTEKIIFRPHNQPITSIKQITNPLALCTSSLDGKIKLWSIQNKQLIIQISAGLEEQIFRNKGLRGLDCFNHKIVSYMACWSFAQEICLWLPSLSLAKPYVGLLKGHIGIVEQCKFSPSDYDKPLLLSIDNKKWVKVWNIELQSCLQTITLQQQYCHLYFLRSRPWLVIYNKLLTFYKIKSLQTQLSPPKQKDNFETKNISDNQLIAINFSNYYDYLLILTQDQLKVIEINSTETIQSIRCEDPSLEYWVSMSKKIDRKIFLSSNTCWIYLYNIDNGLLLKKFQPQYHDKQINMMIKFIHFQKKYSILIMCGQINDNSVILSYDESLSGQTKKLKQAVFAQVNIQHYAFCEKTDIFFLGSDNGLVTIWLLDKLVIANKIDLDDKIMKMQIQDSRSMVFILTSKVLLMYQVQPTGLIKLSKTLHFAVTNPLTFSFVYSTQQLVVVENAQEQQQLKVKRRLNIKTYLHQIDADEMDEYAARFQRSINKKMQRYILSIANYGHTYFYDITAIMYEFLLTDTIVSRNKQHKLKQSRRVIIKSNHMPYPFSSIGLDFCLIKDLSNNTFAKGVKNVESNNSVYGTYAKYLIGNVCGMFYHRIHNGTDTNINFFKPTGKLCGKWSLNSSKSKQWNIHYPIISKILNRLTKTYEILVKIDKINDLENYQLLFLANRFLDKQGLKRLKDLYRTKVTFVDDDVDYEQINSEVSLQNNVKSKKSKFSSKTFKNFAQNADQSKKTHLKLFAEKQQVGNANIFDVLYERRVKNAQKIQKYKLQNIQQRFNKISWNKQSELKMKAEVDKQQQQLDQRLFSKQKRGTSQKTLSKFRIKSSIVNAMNNFRNEQKNYQLLSKKIKNLGSGFNLKL